MPSGTASFPSGPTSDEQSRLLFIAMMFVALATHATYGVIILAVNSSLFSIPLALVASYFWERAYIDACKAGRTP